VERIAHNRLTALLSQIYADATIVFPLLVAQTFAKDFHAEKAKEEVQK
jgi:deoxyhypusine synthase